MEHNYEKQLIDLFEGIKAKGWIKTTRHDDQCLGNTFEDLVGVVENNKHEADFHGIELKTHRAITSSMVSLFSKAPLPRGANTYLRESYGVTEPEYGHLILNTSVAGNKFNTHRGGYGFKIEIDNENKKMWLVVKNITTGAVMKIKYKEKDIGWDFSVLTTALEKKLEKIAIVYGEEKEEEDSHYVKYTKLLMFEGLSLEKMLLAINNGDLVLDIRLGVYLSGKRKGKTHDHGSAFRIKLDKLLNYGNFTTY